MVWILLLQLILGVPAVYCRSHTLYYQITMTSAPTPGIPQFSIIVYVNGIQYGRYNSDIGRAEALIPVSSIPISSLWMVSEHMEHQTKVAQEYEIAHRQRLNFLMGAFNMTNSDGDNHVYQTNNACELHDDGNISGYQEIAFDGKELLVYDKERVTFVPVTQDGVMVTQLWNNRYDSTYTKIFVEIDCIEHMKMYLPYISKDLRKKVPPSVKISSSESKSGIKLFCWVYGFYPRDVDVRLIKNETHELHSEEAPEILPNPDGTYQITVEVTPEEGATYSCHVSHSSLEETLVVPFESNKRSHLFIIISASGTLLLYLLLIALGVFRYRNRKTKDPNNSQQSVSTEVKD